jgi:RNA polymerase sigma-70 factor (sigma-E family)
VATGRSERFAEFVALRSAALQRTAYLLVGDVGLAHDLVREALTRTYMAWGRMNDPRQAEAYARRTITTQAIGASRRRRKRAGRVTSLGETADRDDPDERTWLWLCLLQLPVRQRAAIVLRYYEDLTERETAETMGCRIGVVRSEVTAGLATLRPLVSHGLLPQDVRR